VGGWVALDFSLLAPNFFFPPLPFFYFLFPIYKICGWGGLGSFGGLGGVAGVGAPWGGGFGGGVRVVEGGYVWVLCGGGLVGLVGVGGGGTHGCRRGWWVLSWVCVGWGGSGSVLVGCSLPPTDS